MLNIRKSAVLIVVLTLALSNTACTTVKPVKVAADDIQDQILTDKLLKKGDRINIVTKDGKIHQIKVAAIKEDIIEGRTGVLAMGKIISIPIAEVVTVSIHEISGGKTLGFSALALVSVFSSLILLFFAAHL